MRKAGRKHDKHEHRPHRRADQRRPGHHLYLAHVAFQESHGEDRHGGHQKQCIQADDAVDQHGRHRFSAATLVFAGDENGLEQIAADAAQRYEIQQIAQKPQAEGVAKLKRQFQCLHQKIPADDRCHDAGHDKQPGCRQ
jgi:hypothetical protein